MGSITAPVTLTVYSLPQPKLEVKTHPNTLLRTLPTPAVPKMRARTRSARKRANTRAEGLRYKNLGARFLPGSTRPTAFLNKDLQEWGRQIQVVDAHTNTVVERSDGLASHELPSVRALQGEHVINRELRVNFPGTEEPAWMQVSAVPLPA